MPDPKASVNRNMTLQPGGFHHVALNARDFDKAVAFYTDVLGYTQAAQWQESPKRAIMLDGGDGNYIEIFEHTDAPEVPTGFGAQVAIKHFAIRCADCAATLEKVRAAGCRVEMETRTIDINDKLTGKAMPVTIAFFTGPCGEMVELFQNENL